MFLVSRNPLLHVEYRMAHSLGIKWPASEAHFHLLRRLRMSAATPHSRIQHHGMMPAELGTGLNLPILLGKRGKRNHK
jgi:hypothetical protein